MSRYQYFGGVIIAAAGLAACRSVLGIEDMPTLPGADGGGADAADGPADLDAGGSGDASDATSAVDAGTDAPPDAPSDGFTAPADATPGSPVDWAEWPLPPVALANGNYTLTSDTAKDDVTGLMWTRASSGSLDAASAHAYCAAQNAGGFADWRLPSWIELVTLVDYTRVYPAINTNAFPGTPNDWFWSTTPILASTLRQCVAFSDGTVGSLSTTASNGARARCVRTP